MRRRRWLAAAAAAVLVAAAGVVGCTTLPLWMVLQGRSQISDHRHFDNAPIARADSPSPLPVAAATLRWPGGVDTARMESDAAQASTVALLVAQRGQLVYERYFNGYTRDSLATSFSMAKSVVSLLLGVAVAEGHIKSIDEPITQHLPELLKNDARFARITLRHLLLMRSGIRFDEGYRSPLTEAARFYLAPDLKAQVAGLKIEGEPNQAYDYKSGDTQLLAMALERATGMPLARYAESRLWQPLGAQFDASWSLDSQHSGVARAFCCLNAHAVDYLRLGLMVVNGGRVGQRQVLSRQWLQDSTAAQEGLPGANEAAQRNIERLDSPRAAFYAWQWRRRPEPGSTPLRPGPRIYAQGLHGQVLMIDLESQTVALRLGKDIGDRHWPSWLDELLRLNR
jgi:CubicO group peptidase (beta-lactamase class C family)